MEQIAQPPRFYCLKLAPGEVELDAGESHHAVNVLRLGPGREVELFDGCGRAATGKISNVSRKGVKVLLERIAPCAQGPAPLVHLAFAAPKGKRLDWLLEKATELGAASLRPVSFERSLMGRHELSEPKRQRWIAHCISAAKQARLNFLPQLLEPAGLKDAIAASGAGKKIYGDLGPDSIPIAKALGGFSGGEIYLIVGPEGGLTESERDVLKAGGFLPVRVGKTVLRIETAAVCLVGAVMAICDIHI